MSGACPRDTLGPGGLGPGGDERQQARARLRDQAQSPLGSQEHLLMAAPEHGTTSCTPRAVEGQARWVSHMASRPPRGSWHSPPPCAHSPVYHVLGQPPACLPTPYGFRGRGTGRGPSPHAPCGCSDATERARTRLPCPTWEAAPGRSFGKDDERDSKYSPNVPSQDPLVNPRQGQCHTPHLPPGHSFPITPTGLLFS